MTSPWLRLGTAPGLFDWLCHGQFLVRVVCDCGAVREIKPEALARLVGWKVTRKELATANALLEVRGEGRRGGCGREAQAARHPEEFALGTARFAALLGISMRAYSSNVLQLGRTQNEDA